MNPILNTVWPEIARSKVYKIKPNVIDRDLFLMTADNVADGRDPYDPRELLTEDALAEWIVAITTEHGETDDAANDRETQREPSNRDVQDITPRLVKPRS